MRLSFLGVPNMRVLFGPPYLESTIFPFVDSPLRTYTRKTRNKRNDKCSQQSSLEWGGGRDFNLWAGLPAVSHPERVIIQIWVNYGGTCFLPPPKKACVLKLLRRSPAKDFFPPLYYKKFMPYWSREKKTRAQTFRHFGAFRDLKFVSPTQCFLSRFLKRPFSSPIIDSLSTSSTNRTAPHTLYQRDVRETPIYVANPAQCAI